MATNKMKLRHLYRAGEHKFLEDNYGVVFKNKDITNADIIQRTEIAIEEDKKIKEALNEEEEKVESEQLLVKMEYLDSLDIAQLRSMAKSVLSIPHKTLIRLKKEEIISELLK